MPKITGRLPSVRIENSNLNIPENIELADPEFDEPLEINALLENTLAYRLFSIGQIELSNSLLLQKYKFGWLVTGEVQIPRHNINQSCYLITSLENQVSKFWELEVNAKVHLAPQEVPIRKSLYRKYKMGY